MELRNKILLVFCFLSVWSEVQAQTTDEELAYYYYNNNEFDKAMLYLEGVYEKNSSSQNYTYYINTLLAVKEYKTAEKVAKKQIKLDPRNTYYKVNLGSIFKQSGEEEKAAKYFDELVSDLSSKNSYGDYSNLGNEFLRINEMDYALQVFEKGEKIINNSNLSFKLSIADIYGRKGQNQEMVDTYLDLIDKNQNLINSVQSQISRSIDFTEENEKSEILRIGLLKKIQKNPSQTIYNKMLIWYYQQRGNFEGAFTQVKALDKRSKAEGQEVFQFAQLCMSNKQYGLAIQSYEYILENFSTSNYYYTYSKQQIVNALRLKIMESPSYTKEDLQKLESRYVETINSFSNYRDKTSTMLDFADFEIYYINNLDTAAILLDEVLGYPGLSPQEEAMAKLAKGDVLLIQDAVWEASLLYMQVDKMFKEDVLGNLAKFKNAKLYYYTGDYEWSQNQLNALKASTSKLISNDAIDLSLLITDNYNMDTTTRQMNRFSSADLLILQNKYAEAIEKLDSIVAENPQHSLMDEILYKRYEIAFKKREFEKAEGFLNEIVEKYNEDILADNALYKLGNLYENQLPNKEKAIASYEKLLFDYPGSLYVVEARKRYRELKGEETNTINKIAD